MESRRYKAIFFDLDGTLLRIVEKEFLEKYFVKLGAFAARHGIEPKHFINSVEYGVVAMMKGAGDERNDVKFWNAFDHIHGTLRRADVEPLLEEFYNVDFGTLGDDLTENIPGKQAIDILLAKGYPLYLTTMPVFPLVAVHWRLKWAGIDPSVFQHITHYENSHSAKPQLRYYQANLDLAGLRGEDVLMVGNSTVDDLSARDLGLDAFLVTDCLIDRTGDFDLSTVRHGSMEDFLEFVKTLPECE